MDKAYCLYHNKEKMELKIKPSRLPCNYTYEVISYNENYYICNNRDKLKEKAEEIKEKWLKEAQERVNILSKIKIK